MRFRLAVFMCVALCLVLSNIYGKSKSPVQGKASRSMASRPVSMKSPRGRPYLPDRVIVKVKLSRGFAKKTGMFGLPSLDLFAQRYSVESVSEMFPGHATLSTSGQVDLARICVMKYSAPMEAWKVAQELSSRPDVEYAEPWYIYPVESCPSNDSLRNQQWALTKIMADSAWCISQGDTSVIIGNIDTGVKWDHPDLAANIWANPGETGLDSLGRDKRFNGVDDDGDGYIDDWHGWDFGGADYNNPVGDNNPTPTGSNNAHGTSTAGVATAVTNNISGIAGVGYKCKILPIKTTSDNDVRAPGSLAYIVFWLQGLVYAADRGAAVVNCSFGGAGGASQAEQDVINYATQKGTLIVAAAGNEDVVDPFYPASYDNVLSVAATQSSDQKSSYSNFGRTVDVCAPGDGILSTSYPYGYASSTGTSLAAPNAAGVAALVKSLHKNYTALQVGEQVRISCDDISSVGSNSFYPNYLGKGRINALRALTVSSSAIRMSSYTTSDSAGGNNNGILEPGETVALYATFTNYLAPTTSNARVTLESMDPATLQVLDSVYTIGSLPTLGTSTNSVTPFRLKIGNSVGGNAQIYLLLNFQDGSYKDFQFFQVLVNPLYATHNANNVVFSVSNFGSLGYYDYVVGTSFGDGFQFPKGSSSALFHASLMVGSDANHVSDNAYGTPANPDAVDFQAASNGNFEFLKERGADQVVKCSITDSGAVPLSSRVGVSIVQRSYAYANSPDNDYVIVRYDIRNITSSVISHAYVGIFSDWDVPPGMNTNYLRYDAGRRLGYQFDSTGSNYYGLCLAYPTTAASFRAVDNATYVYGTGPYGGFTESNKYLFLSQGFVVTEGTTPADWSMVLSAGPYTISPGDSVTVGFAFIGGTNLAGLQRNADAAISKWNYIDSSNVPRPRISISVHQNPVLTQFADLYVVSTAALVSIPTMVVETASGSKDTIALSNTSTSIYKGSYQFSSSGTRTIKVHAIGVDGLDTLASRTFQVQFVKRGLAATIRSPKGDAVLSIPENALGEDMYVTIIPEQIGEEAFTLLGPVYSFGPAREFSKPLDLAFSYRGNEAEIKDTRYLHIYRYDQGQWIPIEEWIDLQHEVIRASITSLGEFALGYDSRVPSNLLPSEYKLYQNFPNPFNPQTIMRFALSEYGKVRLRVFNAVGQEVVKLVDDERDRGFYEVTWDGKNNKNETVSSGVYFYTFEVEEAGQLKFRQTEKMEIIR